MKAGYHFDYWHVHQPTLALSKIVERLAPAIPWIKDALAGLALVVFMIAAFGLASSLQIAF